MVRLADMARVHLSSGHKLSKTESVPLLSKSARGCKFLITRPPVRGVEVLHC